MEEKEHRGRISFTEYSDRIRASKRIRVAFVGAVIVLIVMMVAAIILIASLVDAIQNPTVKTSAQDDAALLLEETKDTQTTRASSEAVNLVSLIGLSQQEAIEEIGRGAVVVAEEHIDDLGLKKELSLSLTDEKGTELSGTPSASIKLDSFDKVGAATYSTPLDALGFESISFIDAVYKYKVVDKVLSSVGLTNYDSSSLVLPDRKEYSTYESDQKTLKAETYTFSGTSSQSEGTFSWTATLHYDYAQANKTSNLANTVRKITVSIRKV